MNTPISSLIINDNADKGHLLKTKLLENQINTLCISPKENILETITENNINIVLLDLTKNQSTIIKAIKEFNPLLPIILLLDNFSDDDLYQSLNFIACDYIQKPFAINKLIEVIRKSFFSPKQGESKRTAIRQKIEAKVTINTETKSIQATINNLSEGGAFIKTNDSFELNEKVTLLLQIKEELISINSIIVWQRLFFKEGLTPGIGVKFLDLSKKTKQLITDYIIEYKLDALSS